MRTGTLLVLLLTCTLGASAVFAAPIERPDPRCAFWRTPNGWVVSDERNAASGFHATLLNEEWSSYMQLHGSHPKVPPAFLLGEYAQILLAEGYLLDGTPVEIGDGLLATYVRTRGDVSEAIFVGARQLSERTGLSVLVVVTGPSWARTENRAAVRDVMTSLRAVRP